MSLTPAARRAATLHSSIGRPASATNALGRPAPRRSPLPAATSRATATLLPAGGRLLGGRARQLVVARQDLVEVGLGALLALVERVHQLGGEDLLGARVHLLLA